MGAPTNARQRARAELTRDIKDEARRQLAMVGAPALSLRAVARQLEMASSALYRYFPSRDDLLTALIIDAYDALGEAGEAADRARGRGEILSRWRAVCRAIRAFGLERPNEYALLYGSPVPGYRAPEATIGPASRITLVLAGIMSDAAVTRQPVATGYSQPLPPVLAEEVSRIRELALPGVAEEGIVRGLMAWTQVFGLVSFELFGHFTGVIEDTDTFFGRAVDEVAGFLGLG